MTKQKLPSIAKVKKSLYNDWALRVKQRDGWKCLLCGATDNLTAHHWYVCDHNAHAARYALANGATLCYACHIRGIHQRADWQSVNGLYLRLLDTGAIGVSDPTAINELSKIELTTAVLRRLYGEMRKRVIPAPPSIKYVRLNEGRGFLFDFCSHPCAVVGNVISFEQKVYSVNVVKKIKCGYRYSVSEIDGECGEAT
jgi:hypothetical protein